MRLNKKEVLTEIISGSEDVLIYLSRKYFSSVRKLLRVRGFRDTETPVIFSHVLAQTYLSIRQQSPSNTDFETYFFNALDNYIDTLKEERSNKHDLRYAELADEPKKIVSGCVSILDEQAQKLLYARIVDKLNYEKIATLFQYSNAVIAQHEVNKALNQLEGIVKLRMNISQN